MCTKSLENLQTIRWTNGVAEVKSGVDKKKNVIKTGKR
jgi:hypothetical protein